MDPIFRCQLVHRLLTPDGGECHPCFELAAMLPSLLTHGASLAPLVVLAYSVVQFSGYIINNNKKREFFFSQHFLKGFKKICSPCSSLLCQVVWLQACR